MNDEAPMTWGDFQALFGALMFAQLAALTPRQRERMRDEILSMARQAQDQNDARSAEMLMRLAQILGDASAALSLQ